MIEQAIIVSINNNNILYYIFIFSINNTDSILYFSESI